jgi:hypothetical protein
LHNARLFDIAPRFVNDTRSIVAATPSVAGAAFKNPVDGFVANADFGATDRPNPAF